MSNGESVAPNGAEGIDFESEELATASAIDSATESSDEAEKTTIMRKLTQSVTDGVEVGSDMASASATIAAPPMLFDEETVLLHAITAEYNAVAKQGLEGVYVLPAATDPSEWFGVIFVRRGVYLGAILRFTLRIPTTFPNTKELPTITFDLNVFHPNIDAKTHRLDMSRHFPDGWKAGTHHLYHTLLVLQRTFFKFDTANPVNAEAAALLETDRDRYKALVTECVRHSREVVYDPPTTCDQHVLKFTPWDASVHEAIRKKMLNAMNFNELSTMSSSMSASTSFDPHHSGLSWVDANELVLLADDMS
uniref:UBC core domain-containing protein n=1 Tax=Plectus sambesii TaxID=2011161 RepID=A0A914WU93_9BILA